MEPKLLDVNKTIVMLFLILITSCVNKKSEEKPIVFEQHQVDLGTIVKNDSVTCVFNYKNISDKIIHINNITTSCGCTVPKYIKDSIFGGDSKTIEVTYFSKYAKEINENINVYYNGVGSPVKVFIHGLVSDSIN
jgi:hypothetical protein